MVSWEITIQMLAELADRYWVGFMFAIIAMAFVLACGYLLFKYMNRLIDKVTSPEAQKKTTQQLSNLVDHELNVNVSVNAILDDIRKEYSADRVAVMQYHNGGYYNSGSHKTKVSMTHEVVNQWIGHIAKDMQDIPSAIFTHANSRLLAWEDMTIIYDVETWDGNSDEGVVATYKSIGYKSVYAFAIRKQGFLVGKIVVGYLSQYRLDNDDLSNIMEETKKVELLINL
mgnify:CR=1 FL=1